MITRIYFWSVPSSRVLWAILQMWLSRGPLKRNKEIKFWKLLGTGRGETFTPKDADPRRWGLLVSINEEGISKFENSKLIARWNNVATSSYSAQLKCISVHGSWSGKRPFRPEVDPRDWNGKVAAITRARIKFFKNSIFWRAVPPVTISLKNSPGLLNAIGIGEAPLGLQGTFSLWKDPLSVSTFAYRGEAHKEAIRATEREKWYAEELFSRFAVVEEKGSL
ncbi:MAG: hypothetical protein ACKN8W_06215 [Actinomycetales bacterium]